MVTVFAAQAIDALDLLDLCDVAGVDRLLQGCGAKDKAAQLARPPGQGRARAIAFTEHHRDANDFVVERALVPMLAVFEELIAVVRRNENE